MAGAQGPTDGSAAPYAVHVAMSHIKGIEVDYTPEDGNEPHFYPDAGRPCPTNGNTLTVVVLNRATLGFQQINCFAKNDNIRLQAFLTTLTEKNLVLASTAPGILLGDFDLSPLGGTDFTAKDAPGPAYSYSIIGYGQGSKGIASESYNRDVTTDWHGLNGNVINISSDNVPAFSFRETDPTGFAAVPKGSIATIMIGNPNVFPTGGMGAPLPPNQVVPAGFTSVSYQSPALTGSGGGIWLLVLDRYSLQLVSSATYSATATSGTTFTQIPDLLRALQSLDNTKLVFMTTLLGSNPASAATNMASNDKRGTFYLDLLRLVSNMGVSPYAFDKAMGNQISLTHATSKFTMVGIPSQFATDNTRNIAQWFSSEADVAQQETGALTGTLVRDRMNEYIPSNLYPFNVTSLGNDPTASDLLAGNLSQAIAEAPTVAWPLYDTAGHKNVYGYLSYILVSIDIYGGGSCLAELRYCRDIRFYYTGSQAENIAKTDPATIPIPSEAVAEQNGFTLADWADAVTQLRLERSYLRNVRSYQSWFESVNSDASNNIAKVLTNSATRIATDLNTATGEPSNVISRSPMDLSRDFLTVSSSLIGVVGAAFPPAAVASGLLSAGNGILGFVADYNKTKPLPDPYVTQLSDLLGAGADEADHAAGKFNLDIQVSTATFFNGVYSDWFKLQTIGLMTANPDAPTWYRTQNSSSLATGMGPFLVASARKSFYLQTAGQYFGRKVVVDVGAKDPYGPLVPSNKYPTVEKLNEAVASIAELKYKTLTSYSWNYRDCLPEYNLGVHKVIADGWWIYNYVVLKAKPTVTWKDPFGIVLMGPSGVIGQEWATLISLSMY